MASNVEIFENSEFEVLERLKKMEKYYFVGVMWQRH